MVIVVGSRRDETPRRDPVTVPEIFNFEKKTIMSAIKTAQTKYPVIDLIKNRWSARSFSEKPISGDQINTIIEAGSWAFSAMNEQPWRYIVAHKNTPLFETLFSFLSPGNQPWCKNAAVLVLSLGRPRYANGALNPSMLHDVGSANMLMTLQGNSMGIFNHVMGGYDRATAIEVLKLDADHEPVVMIAFGFLDAPEKLEEPYKTRELTQRVRKSVDELVILKS
jgi:nitroreductase